VKAAAADATVIAARAVTAAIVAAIVTGVPEAKDVGTVASAVLGGSLVKAVKARAAKAAVSPNSRPRSSPATRRSNRHCEEPRLDPGRRGNPAWIASLRSQ